MDNGEVYFTTEDHVKAVAAYDAAKQALTEATAPSKYSGTNVVFDGESVEQVRDIALGLKHETRIIR